MRRALFSVGYAGLWGQTALGTREFIEKAARLGYDGVMLAGKRPHLSPLDATPEHVERIKEALTRTGLRCEVVAAYTDFAGGGAAEVPYGEMQVAYVESLARLAAELGCGMVRVFTAYESPGQTAGVLWPRVVAALRECCDRAAAYGVTIAIQNHHDLAVHTTALLELLGDVDRPNCKLGFDAWSPALRGEDLYEAARRAAPHTVLTTNADYVRLPRFQYQPALVNYTPALPELVRAVPFGQGFIDYAAFFRGLLDGGFDGVATYEMCSPLRGGGSLDNLDRCAAGYLKWMRENVPAR
ncbi:MAG TPA: sugar phosphate isomerase/epimerase family protein [Gemmataceae bacterium]|nr:sugar phosphate isomerase/epimerase family protein [Gemmataceae bacterium]